MSRYFLILPLFCTALPLIRLVLDKLGQTGTFQCCQEEQWRDREGNCDPVQVKSTTRDTAQVRAQPPGVFDCHFVTWSASVPTLPQLQLNTRTLWAPQGKAVTLIILPRTSCIPFLSHPLLCSEEEILLAPAQLMSCSALPGWNTRHKAQHFQGIQEISNQYSARIPAPQPLHYLVWHMHRSHGNQHPSSNSIISAVWGSQNLWCPSHGSELLCANQPQEQIQEEKKKMQQSLVFLICQQHGKQEVAWEMQLQQLRGRDSYVTTFIRRD